MTLLRRLKAYARLIHPFPVAVVMMSSAGLLIVARGGIPQASLAIRAMTVVLLSQVAVGALNDYMDRYTDARTQPDKPIPSGLVSPGEALALALSAGLAVPLAAGSFGAWSAVLMSVATAAGLAYDLGLKRTPLSFLAYVVAFLGLATWIWLITGRLTPIFFSVYPAGFCLLTAAHLSNSLPDIETDQLLGQRGLSTLLGPRRTLLAIVALYALGAVPTVLLSLLTGSLPSLALTLTGCLLAAVSAVLGFSQLHRRAVRKLVFRLMAPAIAVLGLGALVALSRL